MALRQFELELICALDADRPVGNMKVFVLRMCRMNMEAWEELEDKFGEFQVSKGMIIDADQEDAIQLHMEAVGVWMHSVISDDRKPQHKKCDTFGDPYRLFWEQRRCWHLIVAEPFMDDVLEALNAVPRRLRAAPREWGEFNIRDYDGQMCRADVQFHWMTMVG